MRRSNRARAADVREAETLVRGGRPDLAVLELVLPGTPGLTFARQLRGDQRTAGISIIAISARAEESDRVAALEAGQRCSRQRQAILNIGIFRDILSVIIVIEFKISDGPVERQGDQHEERAD